MQHALNGNIENDTRDDLTEFPEWTFEETGAYEGEDYYGDPLEEMQLSSENEVESSPTEGQEETPPEEMKEEIPLSEEGHEVENYDKSDKENKEVTLIEEEYKTDYYRDPMEEMCSSQNAKAGPSQNRKQKETSLATEGSELGCYEESGGRIEAVDWKERLQSATDREKEELKETLRMTGFTKKPRDVCPKTRATKINWKEMLASMTEGDKCKLTKEMEARGFINTPKTNEKKAKGSLSEKYRREIMEALTKMGFKSEDVYPKTQKTKGDWKEKLKSMTEKDRQEMKECLKKMCFRETEKSEWKARIESAMREDR